MTNVRRRLRLLFTATAIVLLGSNVAFAQNPAAPPSTLEQILQTIAGLQATITSLQSTVTSLQATVNGIATAGSSTVRFTPKLFFRSGVMDCTAVNVTSAERHVRITMIDGSGNVVANDAGSIGIPGGASRSIGVFAAAFSGSAYCRFEVLDGAGSDVRGALVIAAGAADDTTKESAPAF